MSIAIYESPLERDEDLVAVRRRARLVSASLGFSLQDQTRIATAVSEIARNCLVYAEKGRVEIGVHAIAEQPHLIIRVIDSGGGIENLSKIVAGDYRSRTGLGLGIQGARRLMDHFEATTGPDGTTIEMGKALPGTTAGNLQERARQASTKLRRERLGSPAAELHQQNRELLQSLQSLREREEDLLAANAALQRTTASLETSLNEKEVLLREVYHRVKNNLQIVSSLVRLQASRTRNEEVRGQLSSLSGRIRSLSLIHDKLYQRQNIARIDLRGYVSDLCSQFNKVLTDADGRVKLACDTCEEVIPLDAAINIGLFLNEAVTNALKHAFPGDRAGKIDVVLRKEGEQLAILVRDDGIGISEAAGSGEEGSLGMTIVRTMATALGGTLQVDGSNGTCLSLTVPVAWSAAGKEVDGGSDETRTDAC